MGQGTPKTAAQSDMHVSARQHNNSIRKLEFARLRALRNAQQVLLGSSGSSSFLEKFSEVATSRHMTVNAIDRIEAVMSRAWVPEPKKIADLTETQRSVGSDATDSLDDVIAEAAIGLVQGEFGNAIACLRQALAMPGLRAERARNLLIALLSVCRCAADEGQFKHMLVNYPKLLDGLTAQQKQWIPFKTEAPRTPLVRVVQKVQTPASLNWVAPALLELDAVGKMAGLLFKKDQTLQLDWSNLRDVSTTAVDALSMGLYAINESKVLVRHQGVTTLIAQLSNQLPTNNEVLAKAYAELHLQILRIVGDEDAFEKKAMQYCLRFELSPPAWKPRYDLHEVEMDRCENTADAAAAQHLQITAPKVNTAQLQLQAIWMSPWPNKTDPWLNQLREMLDAFAIQAHPKKIWHLNCQSIICVEPQATRTLLEWCRQHHKSGVQIEIGSMSFLLSAYWQLNGLEQFASLQTANW